MIDVKLLQYWKAYSPILVTELGIVIDVKLLQPLKVLFPILVTELGIVTEVKLLQQEKASLPILVTEFGMVTDFKPLQLEKADSSIYFTVYSKSFTLIEDGIVMSPEYSLSPFVTIATLFFGVRDYTPRSSHNYDVYALDM